MKMPASCAPSSRCASRPERGGGFNRLAERISRFDEVESCYLMSGGYDLLVFVNGSSLQKVAGVRFGKTLDHRGRALHGHAFPAALLQGTRLPHGSASPRKTTG